MGHSQTSLLEESESESNFQTPKTISNFGALLLNRQDAQVQSVIRQLFTPRVKRAPRGNVALRVGCGKMPAALPLNRQASRQRRHQHTSDEGLHAAQPELQNRMRRLQEGRGANQRSRRPFERVSRQANSHHRCQSTSNEGSHVAQSESQAKTADPQSCRTAGVDSVGCLNESTAKPATTKMTTHQQ